MGGWGRWDGWDGWNGLRWFLDDACGGIGALNCFYSYYSYNLLLFLFRLMCIKIGRLVDEAGLLLKKKSMNGCDIYHLLSLLFIIMATVPLGW